MKKFMILLLGLCVHLCVYAEERYRIKVLNEISYEQAQNYPRKWEISTYTHTDAFGTSTTRYFIFAPSIQHGSEIEIEEAKRPACPWRVRIDGAFYYAEFEDEDELRVGDKGQVRYDGDRLYFCKDE